jgi:hypothetical protein
MATDDCIAIFGLVCALVGAIILAIYPFPEKTFPDGGTVFGRLYLPVEGAASAESRNEEIEKVWKCFKRIQRCGFALLAVGTLFQIYAVILGAKI